MVVGSPRGLILSPLLFLILVLDLEEWVTEGHILSHANDTSSYVI